MSVRDIISMLGSGGTKDPYFENVSMLLTGDGTNGAQNNTFLDSSTNNFTITRNGNTTQGTFSPYGNLWSNYFDGSGDYLSRAFTSTTDGMYLQGTTYTIEAWVYMTSTSGLQIIYDCSGTNTGFFATTAIYVDSGVLKYGVRHNTESGFPFTEIVGSTVAANTWNHVAFSVSSGSGKLFLNGVQTGSTTTFPSAAFTPVGAAIGRFGNGYTLNVTDFTGYISNLRIVQGQALYTSNFTPSTTPLTAVSGTSLLTCQSNRFIDNSSNNFTLTVNGTPSVQRFSPFNPTAPYSAATIGGSGYFDGSWDSLSSTTVFESATNTSTFTIEGFVFPTTFATLINIIGGMVVSSGDQKSIAAEVNTNGQVALYWYDGSIKRCTGNSIMQLNAWNYFAIVVNSNAISIYVNKTTADTLTGTTTLTNRTQLTALGVGAYYNNGNAEYFNGYLSNLRYSTVARTISSIPTTPLSGDSNTRWLCNFTNAGIPDAAMMNDIETVGNAQVSTSVKKYGTGSLKFTQSGGIYANNNIGGNLGSGDFTIEFWLNNQTANQYTSLLDTRIGTSAFAGQWWVVFEYGNNVPTFCHQTSSTQINTPGPSSIVVNQWSHVACVRHNGIITTYVNGIGGNPSNQTSINLSSTNGLFVIGGSVYSYATQFNGYIDDLRITKGLARYTANFTPPAQALPTN